MSSRAVVGVGVVSAIVGVAVAVASAVFLGANHRYDPHGPIAGMLAAAQVLIVVGAVLGFVGAGLALIALGRRRS